MAGERQCPMYWHDHGVRCVLDEHHEPPCLFRGHGALFVSARVYREALALLSSLDPHGRVGDKARRELERLEKA